jgi:RNA polymerase sigma-70 factor (ECF subfamily)
VIYCLVPRDLAAKLYEPLRRHFRDDPTVVVVADHRAEERRSAADRRLVEPSASRVPPSGDRRLISSAAERRIGDRRAATVALEAPPLPRKLRAYQDRLVFVEQLEPSTVHAEDLDTARLVGRIQAGENELFAVLYMRYFERVYGYLRVALKDHAEAEDATQEVFMKVLRALPRYRHRAEGFRRWLFVIVRNHAVSELRRSARAEVTDTDAIIDGRARARPGGTSRASVRMSTRNCEGDRSTPRDGLEAQMLDWMSDRDLQMFIDRLPLAQRQVLFLRYRVGLSTSEVAAVLGQSAESVRKQHSRALQFLRDRLTAMGRDPGRRGRRVPARVILRQAGVVRMRRYSLISPG